jgi:hypothetical protein
MKTIARCLSVLGVLCDLTFLPIAALHPANAGGTWKPNL